MACCAQLCVSGDGVKDTAPAGGSGQAIHGWTWFVQALCIGSSPRKFIGMRCTGIIIEVGMIILGTHLII